MSFTDSSVATLTQPTSPFFNVVVKLSSIDCSAASLSSLTYSVSDTIDIHVPACLITPSSLSYYTTATLTSNGRTQAPKGFETVRKNPDNSYKISLFSNDLLIAGNVYQFKLNFDDPGAQVNQPKFPEFIV